MSVSREEAAAAMREIERIESRSATLRRYRGAAPYLILWGILWAIGYGLTGLVPAHATAIWSVVVAAGTLAGALTLRHRHGTVWAWRYLAVAATLFAFFWASFAVMAPADGRQVAAFIPLVVAVSYVLAGIWWGARYAVAGMAVAAATVVGFFLLHDQFLWWMAVVGSSALLLAGLWLRRA